MTKADLYDDVPGFTPEYGPYGASFDYLQQLENERIDVWFSQGCGIVPAEVSRFWNCDDDLPF